MHITRTILVAVFLALFLLPGSVFAQTGRIVGTVTDANSGESLPGANVIVQGTSTGAASDIDGQYTIRNVPAGTHTVVVSYVGYDRQEREVTVEPDEEVRLDIGLTWSGVQGEEVVITAQARGQNQAINEQITARTIKNVVSSERIRELPDESAATAVSRLPGVSLQNGDQIVVRGIQAKYNTVSVNGVQLPSTTTDRATSLGFISSNMLSGIEVSKTVTPAMDANSIGGNVNLRLKEADEGFHYDAMVQGDYNTQDHTSDNYRAWASVSNRFFEDRLGVFLQANARRFNGGGDIATATWQATTASVDDPALQPYALNQYDLRDEININDEYGASLLLDVRLPYNGKVVLQNAYSSERFDNTALIDRLFLTNANRQFLVDRRIGDRYLLVNSLQGEHEVSNLSVDWSLAHSFSDREDDLGYNTIFFGSDFFEPQGLNNWTSEDQVFDIELQREGANFGAVGDAQTEYDSFNERRLTGVLNLSYPVAVGLLSGEVSGGGKYTKLDRERDYTEYYRRLGDGGDQNAGAAEYLESIGANPSNPLGLTRFIDPDYEGERGDYYLDGRWPFSGALNVDYLDAYFRRAQSGWPTPSVAFSSRYDYEAEEEIAAGYVMGDFDVGRYFTLLGGVRYERYSFDNRAPYVNQTLYDGSGAVLDTLSAARSMGQWFPNVQLQIKPTDWLDLRLAYTKSTSRPDYARMLPNTFTTGDTGQAGNPNLRPTISDNFDAYASVYANRVGLFTFGVFRKELSDVVRPISIMRRTLEEFEGTFWAPVDAGYTECADGELRVSCPDGPIVATMNPAGRIETYVNNPYDGTISGFEVDWQTNFWYLPRPLNSVVFNINYTRLNSEMKYQSIFFDQEGPFSPIIQVDSFRMGRLYQQADDILNVSLGADVRGFSGRVSFRYQGQILFDRHQNDPSLDQYTEPVYGWDFSLRQRLPIEGLALFFNGVNITHPAQYNTRTLVKGESGNDPVDARTRIAYYPRRFQLGIRYGL